MKRVYWILIAIIIAGCGKKLPPPSPDIFAPGLIRADFYINNEIRFTFTEDLSGTIDSGFLMINDSTLAISEYYADRTVLAVQYREEMNYTGASLYGVADKNNNKRDFTDIHINGTLIRDTMAPRISKTFFADSTIRIVCSEHIDSVYAVLLPEYVQIKYMHTEGNRLDIALRDSVGIYPKRVILYHISDIAGNAINNMIVSEQLNDSFFSYSITDTVNALSGERALYNIDTLHIHSAFPDSLGIIMFDGLSEGIYYIELDTLKEIIINKEDR